MFGLEFYLFIIILVILFGLSQGIGDYIKAYRWYRKYRDTLQVPPEQNDLDHVSVSVFDLSKKRFSHHFGLDKSFNYLSNYQKQWVLSFFEQSKVIAELPNKKYITVF